MDWVQTLRQLLCDIYQQWGGDCDDLFNGTPAVQWCAYVYWEWLDSGAPAVSGQALTDYLALLDALETHLGLSGNTLDSEANGYMAEMISGLRAQLSR